MRIATLVLVVTLVGIVFVPPASAEPSAPSASATAAPGGEPATADTGPDPGSSCRPYCFVS